MDWLELGYLGLFLATFLAATVLPFSSEAILGGMLYASFDPITCLIVATLGNSLGGLSSYGLGYLGDWHKLTKWLKTDETKVKRWQELIARYGSFTAILCWLPIVGDVIAIALGLFKTPFVPVALWMVLGKGLRYAFLTWLFLQI